MKRIVAILIVLATVLFALVHCVDSGRSHAQVETFTADNIVATTSIKDNGLTASTIVINDGSKVLQSYAGSGCGPGSAIGALSGSGGASCIGVATNGTPSVSISHTTFSGPINLSTLGTIDWYDCGASTAPNSIPAYGQNFPHSKFTGGFIWRTAGFRGANATFTSGTDQTFTSTAADDQATNALSSNAYCDLFNTTGGIGFGEGMTVPADPAANRVLRIYWLTGSGCETTTTAVLSDGTSNTDVINTGGGTTNYVITVTFHGKAAGDVLNVRAMITASTGSCALGWYAASLGSS